MTNYQSFTDEQLFQLLFTEEDRLPREAVDEFVSRGERMLWPLAEIVGERYQWTSATPQWWSVVHASFILGAIGGPAVSLPLAKAIRWAVAYDCDWVTEKLPSIFGTLGAEAVDVLKIMSHDLTSDWYTRSVAMDGLAAITLKAPETADDTFSFIGKIFKDEFEDWEIRRHSGNLLLDFLRQEYEAELIDFGKEEAASGGYMTVFTDDDVRSAFSSTKKDLWHYTLDWLSFYSADEIRKRQDRWADEDRRAEEKARAENTQAILSGQEPYVREAYIGRNDPCPCGSGKKYKKCCLGKEVSR